MNKDENIQGLMKEILSVTATIQNEFPTLCSLLDENPLFLSYTGKGITSMDLSKYMASLRM